MNLVTMCRKKLYNFNDCLKSEFDAVILTEQKKIYTGFVPSLLHHAMFPKQSTGFIKNNEAHCLKPRQQPLTLI